MARSDRPPNPPHRPRRSGPESRTLFDFPLQPDDETGEGAPTVPRAEPPPEPRNLFDQLEAEHETERGTERRPASAGGADTGDSAAKPAEPILDEGFEDALPEELFGDDLPLAEPTAGVPSLAGVGERLRSGLFDLAALSVLAVVLLVGIELLGVRPDREGLIAVGVFLLVFSIPYTVIPLAFWGATPGMAWVGLRAHDDDGGLAFRQAARRWLGALVTLLLVGLPLALALSGRSLADRWSSSHTWRLPE